jgi:hypothetical protein
MAYETGRITTADPSAVTTRDQLAEFVGAMLQDFERCGHAEWENPTLDRFLAALAAVVEARFVDKEAEAQDVATWRLVAELLAVATGYE